MRIRSTKPEFWKSRRIAKLTWDERLVLKGLESYVDDNGVGIDDIELIVTDVFPRDMFANPRETVARVSEAISSIFRAGLIHRYEAGGDKLLFISFWEDTQRIDKPGKGRKPRPDGTFEYRESRILEPLASPPETLAPGTGEQGNRGTEEQGNKTSSSTSADAELDPEVLSILEAIDEHCVSHDFKKPNRTKANINAAKLLITNDGYTLKQVLWIIDWVNRDSFWAPNIRSATKLRTKFEQLKAKAVPTKAATPDRVEAAFDVARELRALEDQQRLEITT